MIIKRSMKWVGCLMAAGLLLLTACNSATEVRQDANEGDNKAQAAVSAAAETAEDAKPQAADVAQADDAKPQAADVAQADDAKPQNVTPAPDADGHDENDPALANLTRCEAKIDYSGSVYMGESLAPTIEEARDSAIEEACAIPCAETLSDDDTETQREDKLEHCIEACADTSIAIAAQCWHNGISVYTEGAWSPTNDAAPTNGQESPDPRRQP